jgi:hypothetical protein
MKIQLETTYNLGDLVYFLKHDKIVTGNIYKIEVTVDIDGQTEYLCIRPLDSDHTSAVVRPHQAFNSREQLIQSL